MQDLSGSLLALTLLSLMYRIYRMNQVHDITSYAAFWVTALPVMFYNGLNWAIAISRCFYVQVYVCESVVRLLLDCRAAWNLSKAQTHTKAFLTFLNLSHIQLSLFCFPGGFDSLAVFEVSGMQAALHCLPPASFNAPRHRVRQAITTRRPPSIPKSTPWCSFLAPGHRTTEGSTRRRAGEVERGGKRGQDKHWEKEIVTGFG